MKPLWAGSQRAFVVACAILLMMFLGMSSALARDCKLGAGQQCPSGQVCYNSRCMEEGTRDSCVENPGSWGCDDPYKGDPDVGTPELPTGTNTDNDAHDRCAPFADASCWTDALKGDLGDDVLMGGSGDDVSGFPSSIPTEMANITEPSYAVPLTAASPLVLDLNNDGKITVTNLDDNPGSFFDIDEDGLAEQIAWVGPEDGLLVRDLLGNGYIADASALFGSATEDGFTQLARLDANEDGVVDQADPEFASLLIWRDDDGDGFSSPGELHALSAFSISAIQVKATPVNRTNAGNRVSHVGSFTVMENGRAERRAVHDIWFRYRNMNSWFLWPIEIDEQVASLPDLRGYGAIPNLRIAMSFDQTLFERVDQLAAKSFEEVFREDGQTVQVLRETLFTWAGVSDVAADSRGVFIDGQELAFLERLVEQDYLQRGIHDRPFKLAADILVQLFEHTYNHYHARLLSQLIGEEIFRLEAGYTLQSGSQAEPKSAYDLRSDEFEGIAGLKPSGIDALEAIAREAADPNYVWLIALRVIEFSVGLDKLPDEDLALLSQALAASGASPLSIHTLALQAPGQFLADALQGRDSRARLKDTDRDGRLVGSAEDEVLIGGNGDEILEGGDGADEIRGNGGDDILDGQADSDFLLGGLGSDTYLFGLGSSIDVINERGDNSGRDILKFGPGIALDDLIFERRGNTDLMISLRDNPLDAVLIENQFNTYSGLEVLQFADGSEDSLVVRRYAVMGTANADKMFGIKLGGSQDDDIQGLGGDDIIQDDLGDDRLDGGQGDDRIQGGEGDDVLIGGPGNDLLAGGAGNDEFEGGAGNDVLIGGSGDDLFRYESGHDELNDSAGRLDRIVAGSIGSNDAAYLRIGSDLKIVLHDRGSLYLSKQFAGRVIESITYTDRVVDLSSVEYSIQGGPGNDRLRGDGRDDTLIGVAGDDILQGGGGDDSLDGGIGNDRLDGGKGDDVLAAGHGDDVVQGGWGDDHFTYLSGHDHYSDAGGEHDVVSLSGAHTQEQVELLRRVEDPRSLRVEINETNSVTLNGHFTAKGAFEEIYFEATTDRIDLKTLPPTTMGSADDDVLHGVKRGANRNDKLLGLAGNDRILAGDGDDWLAGGSGNDRLEGGAGADIYFYAGGDGDDTIVDTKGNDGIRFGEGIDFEDLVFTEAARDLVIELPSHGNGRLTLTGQLGKKPRQIEYLEFSDGSTRSLVTP
jgi:Ca2+-binding RTX toxin-like protein